MLVEKDKVVYIDYTLTSGSGDILDKSAEGSPLAYLHGRGHIIPGLENALEGKKLGDSLTVPVPAAEGYGERDDRLLTDVTRDQFNGIEDLKVGMQFQAQTPQGIQVMTICDIEGDKVTLDGNHPLAGVDLNFDVNIVDVRDASTEELAHGHVHQAGGCCGGHEGESCCGDHDPDNCEEGGSCCCGG